MMRAAVLCLSLWVALPLVAVAQSAPTYTMNNAPVSTGKHVPKTIIINKAEAKPKKASFWRRWFRQKMSTPANSAYYQNRDTGL